MPEIQIKLLVRVQARELLSRMMQATYQLMMEDLLGLLIMVVLHISSQGYSMGMTEKVKYLLVSLCYEYTY